MEERPAVHMKIIVEFPPEYTGEEAKTVEVTKDLPLLVIEHGQLDFRTAVRVRLVSALEDVITEVPLPHWVEPW